MSVRDTLDKLENMVVGASHFPFTEKTLINDNELIHYVDELRNDLPKELNRADEIMKNRDEIIRNAEKEAEQIKKEAKEYANRVTDESEIVLQAKEKAKTILQQTQQHQVIHMLGHAHAEVDDGQPDDRPQAHDLAPVPVGQPAPDGRKDSQRHKVHGKNDACPAGHLSLIRHAQ